MSEQNLSESLSKLKIKNKSDLKILLKFLESQGFGHQSDYEFHRRKVDSILFDSNKLGVKYDDSFKTKIHNLDDYDEAKKLADQFFSKFGVDDKVLEYLNTFYIKEDSLGKTPSFSRPSEKDVLEWFKFKTKYDIKDESVFKSYESVHVYDLDKNLIKINFGEYKSWEFKRLYYLIFNEDCIDFNERKVGDWINIGKIEIKFFANGNAAIKGDLAKFKEYYYKYLKGERWGHRIIFYNKKREIIINNRN
jgi:hypothetical protein